MKKTLAGFTVLAITGIMTIGSASSVYAAGISQEDAQKTAIAAAGVNEKDILFSKTAKGFDDGIARYEFSFRTADGMEYEYDISVSSGKILEKNAEFDD